MPTAWDRFVTDFLEPVDRGDSGAPDLDRVRQLDTPERRKAARELLDRLEGPGADHVIDALGELMMPLAVPRLQRLLKAAGPADSERRRRIGRALWLIGGLTPDTPATAHSVVIEVAEGDPYWGHRMRAVIDLRHVGGPGVDDVLAGALSDPHPLVRHHAALSIAARSGCDGGDSEVIELANAVLAPDESERVGAIERLRAMAAEP